MDNPLALVEERIKNIFVDSEEPLRLEISNGSSLRGWVIDAVRGGDRTMVVDLTAALLEPAEVEILREILAAATNLAAERERCARICEQMAKEYLFAPRGPFMLAARRIRGRE